MSAELNAMMDRVTKERDKPKNAGHQRPAEGDALNGVVGNDGDRP